MARLEANTALARSIFELGVNKGDIEAIASNARKLGVQFRREVMLAGRYVVDFAAPAPKLVVEVDGGYHRARG